MAYNIIMLHFEHNGILPVSQYYATVVVMTGTRNYLIKYESVPNFMAARLIDILS